MRITNRILAVSGLTGMLAALAFAAPAGATNVDRIKGVCLTGGTVKVNPAVPFTGGTGGYTYTELFFDCVSVELSKGTSVAVSLTQLDINSPGTYTNIVCGTGKAVGTPNGITVNSATVTAIVGTPKVDTVAELQTMAADLDYAIEFVAFLGVLKWTDPAGEKLSVEVPKLLTAGPSGFPGGVVILLIDQTKASTIPTACTKAYQVVAATVVDWSPANPIV